MTSRHRATWGKSDIRSVRIEQGGNAVVGADRQEVRIELIAGPDVDGVHRVGQAALLQHDVDLVTVRCRPGVELDHRRVPAAGSGVWRPSSSLAIALRWTSSGPSANRRVRECEYR